MKYTIELTSKQKGVIDSLLEIVHRHIGFNAKLEPMKELFTQEEVNSIAAKELTDGYNQGYNTAINDYNMMFEFIYHNHSEFRAFLVKSGFYESEMIVRSSSANILFDLICDHDIREVISAFQKWQEKKKQDEEIKVGDEVYIADKNDTKIVTAIVKHNIAVTLSRRGKYCNFAFTELHKTGRNVSEKLQALFEE